VYAGLHAMQFGPKRHLPLAPARKADE
jgi:hypothetical protein